MFKDLGVGVGLRPDHYENFFPAPPRSVSWIEVISENFMDWADGTRQARAKQHLHRFRKDLPVVLHGVSLSLGSVSKTDRSYLRRLKALMDEVEPTLISDHLCWTGTEGNNLHDLLPIPYTEEALRNVVQKIQKTQDFLGRRILVENVSSYIQFQNQDMSEWEFLANVSRQADCGILLDINNIYVSSVNHCFDPHEYLEAIPWERVGQIHLAGHSNLGTHLIDTHDHPVSDKVWDLYKWVISNRPPVSAMIERDGRIPDWNELEKEILKIHIYRKPRDAKAKLPRGHTASF